MNNDCIDYNQILDESHYYLDTKEKSFNFFVDHSQISLNKKEEIRNYFKALACDFFNREKIYLVHITTRVKDIEESQKMLCSSGCLVGSLYCVPAFKISNIEFVLHNLGKYIFQKEVNYFSDNKDLPEILLIEAKVPKNYKNKAVGLNYLKLGNFHLKVFNELKFLLHINERKDVDGITIKMLDDSKDLIFLLNNYSRGEILKNFNNFYTLLIETIKRVPIFGYFLFEITSEFIAYKQNDDVSEKISNLKELYVGHFKDLVFETLIDLNKKFDLGKFIPDKNKLLNYFNSFKLSFDEYKEFLVEAVQNYINKYLFKNKVGCNFFAENMSIEDYANICPDFVGHILHRIIRKMNRYPNFYINFDTYKAIKIWNYWNKNEVFVSYNSLLPKGEMGINPVVPGLEYKMFKTAVLVSDKDKVLISPRKEINVKIIPQLAALDKLLMRRQK